MAREHGQTLLQKESLPNLRYSIIFSQSFPDIVCLHESVGRFSGLSLEAALAREKDEAPFVKKVWFDEHSINAIWQGFDLDEFATSWKNLLPALNDLGPISFGHTLGLPPDTFPTICAELLPLFSPLEGHEISRIGSPGGSGDEQVCEEARNGEEQLNAVCHLLQVKASPRRRMWHVLRFVSHITIRVLTRR